MFWRDGCGKPEFVPERERSGCFRVAVVDDGEGRNHGADGGGRRCGEADGGVKNWAGKEEKRAPDSEQTRNEE